MIAHEVCPDHAIRDADDVAVHISILAVDRDHRSDARPAAGLPETPPSLLATTAAISRSIAIRSPGSPPGRPAAPISP
jgi:hypothetical protein